MNRQFSPKRINGKECRLNIVGVLNDGERLNLKVQAVNCGQLERGVLYVDVMRTISVNILAFDLFNEEEDFRNSFSIRNNASGNRLCDDFAVIYFEIPKYRRSAHKPMKMNKLER